MVVGFRVVRGPDWNQENKDGGEHHVGTITGVKGDNCVEVIWDSGETIVCRAGQDGKHDLRLFDSGPRGIRHKYIRCKGCDVTEITGTCWRCAVCPFVNLCTPCYYDDCHDTSHPFMRIDFPGIDRVKVTRRSGSEKARVMGLYPEAEVKRGPHWQCSDGAENSVGVIIDIVDCEKGYSVRDGVLVKWPEDESGHVHRVGHMGKVDLCCHLATPGADYYSSHVTNVDLPEFRIWQETFETMKVGDKVYIDISEEDVKRLAQKLNAQQQVVEEKDLSGAIGIVKSTANDGGSYEVQFGELTVFLQDKFLTKVPGHRVGDVVRMIETTDTMKMFQEKHGSWDSDLEKFAGQLCKVTVIDADGDVGVKFDTCSFVVHPACLIPASGDPVSENTIDEATSHMEEGQPNNGNAANENCENPHTNINPSLPEGSAPESLNAFEGLLYLKMLAMGSALESMMRQMGQTFESMGSTLHQTQFLHAVVANRDADVKRMLQQHPEMRDFKVEGTPCLCHAAYNDFTRTVAEFIDAGADINIRDNQGCTPLIAALAGKSMETAELLVDRGANLDAANNKKQTALHVSAIKNLSAMLTLLLNKGCDPNVQDNIGNTPLHYAIHEKHDRTATILIQWPRINLWLKNHIYMNALAHACFVGHTLAVEKLIATQPMLVNSPFSEASDRHMPLHIAAVNNHMAEAKLLLEMGHANINVLNVKQISPLHLAASEGYFSMAELLINHGAVCTLMDVDGNTPLHVCMMSRRHNPLLFMNLQNQEEDDERIKLAILLLRHKASPTIKNRAGLMPVEGCPIPRLRSGVETYLHAEQQQNKDSCGQNVKENDD